MNSEFSLTKEELEKMKSRSKIAMIILPIFIFAIIALPLMSLNASAACIMGLIMAAFTLLIYILTFKSLVKRKQNEALKFDEEHFYYRSTKNAGTASFLIGGAVLAAAVNVAHSFLDDKYARQYEYEDVKKVIVKRKSDNTIRFIKIKTKKGIIMAMQFNDMEDIVKWFQKKVPAEKIKG